MICRFLVCGEEVLVDVLHGVVSGPTAAGHSVLVNDPQGQHDRGVGMAQSVDAGEGNALPVADPLQLIIDE